MKARYRSFAAHRLGLIAASAFMGCGQTTGPTTAPTAAPLPSKIAEKTSVAVAPAIDSSIRFEHLDDCGIEFVYYGNPSDEHYMTEQNGGGVALFDYDGDGWCDVFLVNGSNFARPAADAQAVHALYRNLSGSRAALQFAPVGPPSGLAVSGFGMGAASGDYDNDGFPDLFVCHYGEIRLWRNQGDGTFADVSTAAGLIDTSWSAGAAFADLDQDGDLDLYVTNYVVYGPDDPPCFTQHERPVRISCGPIGRVAQPDTLWENLGDGTFRDASEAANIRAVPPGKGLAVEIADLNDDGRPDIFVANDTTENLLFINQGGLRFEERGMVAGVALSSDGTTASAMGIACADFDGNGLFDLFVTNFENAIKNYYQHVSTDGFVPRSAEFGLDITSRHLLSFGTVAGDFDLDGWPDLFVTNGHIWDLTTLGFGHQYAMRPELFQNHRGRRFREVSPVAGSYFNQDWVGRAAAVADLDRDGQTDLVVTHLLRPTAVLRNTSDTEGHGCLRVRLIGRQATRCPLGNTLRYMFNGQTRLARVPSGGSFAASHEPVCLLSTGAAETIDELVVNWGHEHAETWHDLPARGEITLIEGARRALSVRPSSVDTQ